MPELRIFPEPTCEEGYCNHGKCVVVAGNKQIERIEINPTQLRHFLLPNVLLHEMFHQYEWEVLEVPFRYFGSHDNFPKFQQQIYTLGYNYEL